MIAKAFRMRNNGKTSMKRLVEYLTSDQNKRHRVADILIANCTYESPELAMREMLVTQARNRRATSDKTYHLMVSFRPGEDPTPETLRAVEAAVCKKLGFGEHQRIAVVHRDTDSVHLHVAINKIHPKRFTIHNPYRDWKELGKECERLEKSLYLAADNHTPTGRTETERRARDIEALTGEQSLLSWIRQECLPALKAADSWEAFHRELAKAGLSIKLQNNGVNFVAASGECVKGSGVDRAFSKAALEKRFGAFQEKPGTLKGIVPEKAYRRPPLDVSPEAKTNFAQAKERNEKQRKDRVHAVRSEQDSRIAVLLAEIKNDRLQARRTPASRPMKKKLYAAINCKYRAKLAAIRREARQKRQIVYRESPRYTWISFLQERAKDGDQNALEKLRGRAFSLAWKGGSAIRGENDVPPGEQHRIEQQPIDSVTKKGTIIYSVGKDELRDDGESFRINRDADLETAIVAMQIAQKRNGHCLRIDGDRQLRALMVDAAVAGKLRLTFSDTSMEMQRAARMQQQAHTPTRQQRDRI